MLAQFSVRNFKNFKEELIFNFEDSKNYEFNSNAIQNNAINKGLIYGINGCGKSNLGLALFDIVLHLTDKEKTLKKYVPYRNLDSEESAACFMYKFKFDNHFVEYSYKKIDAEILQYEQLKIDGKEVLEYDYGKMEGRVILKGAERLNHGLENRKLSFVKYVSRNTVLEKNEENVLFVKFLDFVERMLLFYSLSERFYQGFMVGRERISARIIEDGKVKDFEHFLQKAGIYMSLGVREVDDEKQIVVKYDSGEVNFYQVASTGTKSLALFYYWYIQMEHASLVFIDEFDAFYHYELAEEVVRLMRDLKNVQVMLTTHNTDLMNNDLLRPDCCFLLSNNKIRSLASSTQKELRKAHNIQKMYKAGAFDE